MEDVVYSVLGGDVRQRECAKILAAKGNTVMTYGLDHKFKNKDIKTFKILDKDFFNCDVLLLPIPYKNSEGHINRVKGIKNLKFDDFVELIHPTTHIILGKADSEIKYSSKVYGFNYIDLLQDETFSILNSIPSAEGAIQRAMEMTDITLHSAKILVLGYGRLGKTLARMLAGIGAKVTVEARKDHDLAWITESGYESVAIEKLDTVLHDQDIIFNTIPALILDRDRLSKVQKGATIIDLASYPGGTDFQAAREFGIEASLELGLPGVVAPRTAAQIICMRIKELIRGQ